MIVKKLAGATLFHNFICLEVLNKTTSVSFYGDSKCFPQKLWERFIEQEILLRGVQ